MVRKTRRFVGVGVGRKEWQKRFTKKGQRNILVLGREYRLQNGSAKTWKTMIDLSWQSSKLRRLNSGEYSYMKILARAGSSGGVA